MVNEISSYIRRYLSYLFKAKTKYYIHSPFVYQLCEEVIFDKRHYYAFEDIAYLRKKLLTSKEIIKVTDYGAGSQVFKKEQRAISKIVKHASIPPKFGRLLFRLVHHFSPCNILELGTSLGMSTLYQAKAMPSANIISLEGCPNTAQIARSNFSVLQAHNIDVVVGQFKDTLSTVLKKFETLDFIFIDGHHQQEATLSYFEQCLPFIHNNSIIIFDDIHWSSGMEKAWQAIKKHPNISVTIDVFKFGIVFFRKEQEKENFILHTF